MLWVFIMSTSGFPYTLDLEWHIYNINISSVPPALIDVVTMKASGWVKILGVS